MTDRSQRRRMPPSRRTLVLFAAGWACIAAGCSSPDIATGPAATTRAPTPPLSAPPQRAAPLPFVDGREVDADALFAALRAELPAIAASPVVREE